MQKIKSTRELEAYLNSEFTKLRNSNKTITPNSKYFNQIGSTTCEDIDYIDQLKIKLDALKLVFGSLIEGIDLTIEKSPKIYEYRLKMEFNCAFNPIYEPHSRFGQRKRGNFNWVVDMDECNLINAEWFNKTRKVYDFLQKLGIRNYDLKKQDGELRYIVIRSFNDEGMLTIITKTSDNKELIKETANYALELGFKSVYWLKNDSVSDVATGEVVEVLGEDGIDILLKVDGNKHFFKVNTFTFFQNNIYGFEKMLEYIAEFLRLEIPNNVRSAGSGDSLLCDFFCGTGVIGIALSSFAKKVVGFDIIQENIDAAVQNAELNKIKNIEFKVSDLYKLEDAIDFNKAEPSIAIVDPPRTGLGIKICELLNNSNLKNVIYISCNPITQAQDLERLTPEYKIVKAKGFDMFPQTNHIENIVILERLRS